MNVFANVETVASPQHQSREFVAYEAECKDVLRPLLDGLIDRAENAGWRRCTVASALMFLAAQHVSATSAKTGSA